MNRISAALLVSSLLSLNSHASDVYRCVDRNGKAVFTDTRKTCEQHSHASDPEISQLTVEIQNLHSQYGALVSKEYYNYAFRKYASLNGYQIDIIAEEKLLKENPKVLDKAAKKLERTTLQAIAAFPRRIQAEFNDIQYYLFSGNESKTGGRKGGQWYFHKGNSISALFDDSIVVRSAKGYLNYSDTHAVQTAIHELSHAYYWYHRKRLLQPVDDAFKQAVSHKLYLNVKHRSGRLIKKAYALTNRREYFAELSKIYLAGNHYFPFTAEELKAYDSLGYHVIQRAFSHP